jgi:hypothetical protein
MLDFVKTMVCFYAAIAVAMSILVAIEYDLGVLERTTFIRSIIGTAGPWPPYADPQLIGMF